MNRSAISEWTIFAAFLAKRTNWLLNQVLKSLITEDIQSMLSQNLENLSTFFKVVNITSSAIAEDRATLYVSKFMLRFTRYGS